MTSPPASKQWYKDVPRNSRGLVVAGVAVLLVWGIGFGAWAAMAPLDGAIVAAGRFVATGQNKMVQHLEGGILRETLVSEGEQVEAQQPLVRLDTTATRAKLRRLELRECRLSAIQARLAAEISSHASLEVPAELAARIDDPEVKAIIDGQSVELAAKRSRLEAEELVLRKEIAALQESINGFKAQEVSLRSRLTTFDDELRDKNLLMDRQLARRSEVYALQRAQAGLAGDLGELVGRIADARERIARAEQQIVQVRSTAVQQSVEDLRKAEADYDDVEEQIRAARDVVERSEVRAPVRGIVVKLNYNTAGGVIGAGDVILELLPTNDGLVIEARVKPGDIQHIQRGQQALVRLSALNQRVTPMVEGEVEYVSADSVQEREAHPAATGVDRASSFIVRVKLVESDARHKAGDFRPTPGMPADIYIKTSQRTFFEYMLRPLRDSFSRAFRES
ncbi:MAG: HlyD family type I secretion periplasmic adaptor subunit [Hyphomicrobium sp.]|uniref:HlyD family type I secretion periplasmic adaptor subunit n=1 Tax=Hyphomicrobium sp. TaxID=82 RepID=UPI003D0EA025